jgi:TonB family protein
MKTFKIILVIISIGIILSGCSEKKNRVEVVPNLENEYMSLNDVDNLPDMGKDFYKKMDNDFEDAVKNLHVNNPKAWTLFIIKLRVYLNKKGTIDKIKDLYTKYPFQTPDSVIIYNNREELDKQLALKLSNLKFPPFQKNGKNVKVWYDLTSEISLDPHGKYNVGPPYFTLIPTSLHEDVDKMPSLVKSFKPHYPTIAKLKGTEGKVYVKVYVNAEGKPLSAVILKSDNKVFNQPSIDAAAKFKFSPAMKDNKPVGAWVVLPFKYTLDSSKNDKIPSEMMEKK